MDEAALKSKLQTIAQADYAPPDSQVVETILEACLEHLGSVDGELRDGLIYNVLARWMTRSVLDPEQIRRIWSMLLDEEHLFFGLGEKESDSVFMRSFSVLLLAVVVYAHRQTPFMSGKEVGRTLEAVLEHMRREQDRRGFVPGKGWAHAIAHNADTVDELALCEEVSADQLAEILGVLFEVLTTGETVYTHQEDERITTAVMSIWGRGLIEASQFEAWLAQFPPLTKEMAPIPEAYYRQINSKHFMRSLYHRARKAPEASGLFQILEGMIDEVGRF